MDTAVQVRTLPKTERALITSWGRSRHTRQPGHPPDDVHRMQLERIVVFFFSSRRRHTRLQGDWSSDVCSSDLPSATGFPDSSTTTALMPGKARVAEPGLRAVSAGRGEIRIMPVSVCHQVSTKIGRASCRERV